MRRDVKTLVQRGAVVDHAAFPRPSREIGLQPRLGLGVDHRANMRRDVARIAQAKLARGALDQCKARARDVLLHA